MKHFSDDISLVLGGAAGQGVQTVEALLMGILKREGYRVFASKEYMSRIRGGSNSTEIRITKKARAAFVARIDFLFAMDKDVVPHLEERISEDTIIFGEAAKLAVKPGQHLIDIPFTRFANELGNPLYTSTVAVGVALGVLAADSEEAKAYLSAHFARKGEEVVAKNIEALQKGYDFGKHLAYEAGIEIHLPREQGIKEEIVISGDEALGMGVLAAGCNYISSYPMSPGTGLLTFLAEQAHAFGVVVDQAEDEIAAINQGLGAWYAGARAIVTTSGGGFALMCEGVSLAGMIETPIVIHVGQRPGPATGLPTRTEQADLDLVRFAGHGEFPRVIFAPGTHEQLFALTEWAFELADKYQVPAFILTDQYLLDSVRSFASTELAPVPVSHHFIEAEAGYKRYAYAASGVSPRGIPGYGAGLVGVDSDEHDEEAHITESASVRKAMHEKRLAKFGGLTEEALMPEILGDAKSAKTLIVSWGSNRGVVTEALESIGNDALAGVHFSQVYPLPPAGKKLFAKKKVVVLENNATGQFARLLSETYGVKITGRVLKYDGNPFSVEETVKELKTFL
ncbi:MAG: 2-oxoacid:acceptor oxidoreductase subunit alpha [Candidatus Moraniibacteriota bacterium]